MGGPYSQEFPHASERRLVPPSRVRTPVRPRGAFMRHVLTLLAAATLVTACASTEQTRPGPTESETPAAAFALQPARFEDIPDWTRVDLAPALLAFRRTCEGRRLRDPSAALPGGGRYGGTVAEWAPACAAAQNVAPGGER